MNGLQPLLPFAGAAPVTVHAGVERRTDGLCLRYLLGGELSLLSIPPLKAAPSRQDRLWETTCLECFFGLRDRPGYWEVNLSPTGDWNVYTLSKYRQGMREETTITELAVTVTATADTIALAALLPTTGLFGKEDPLRAGLCGVLQEQSGRKSFWALAHPATQPDFHDQRGFVLAS